MKRIATPKAIPIVDKKAHKWIIQGHPGAAQKKYAIVLSVLLRDVLKIARTLAEVRKILNKRLVLIDGKVRTEVKFPVGFMDIITFANSDTAYRLVVDWKGRIVPMEITKDQAKTKIAKVVGKHTMKGGKLSITLHDGKNLVADNHIKVGDSVVLSLPDGKLKSHLKSNAGCRCLIREGKHAGTIVKLKEIIQRKGGKTPEALVISEEKGNLEFITVANYLVVVDDSFHLKSG